MKAVICGAGKMGIATIWAMSELGYDINVIDISEEALKNVLDEYSFKDTEHPLRKIVQCWTGTAADYVNLIKEAEIVISTLPYHANYNLAILCVNNNVPYCDLGGHVRTSESIQAYKKVVVRFLRRPHN